jgi:hypothetical protein
MPCLLNITEQRCVDSPFSAATILSPSITNVLLHLGEKNTLVWSKLHMLAVVIPSTCIFPLIYVLKSAIISIHVCIFCPKFVIRSYFVCHISQSVL